MANLTLLVSCEQFKIYRTCNVFWVVSSANMQIANVKKHKDIAKICKIIQ